MPKIIAEVGSVHDGSFGNAKMLIRAIADTGAWAIKFQHHIATEETTYYAPNPAYFKHETRTDYFNRIAFSQDEWAELYELSHEKGLKFVVSPFSIASLRSIIKTGVDYIKVASGEVTNGQLLKEVKNSGKGVFLSSGMSTYNEIKEAIAILGNSVISLMQCTSEYPCSPGNVGLNNISILAKISNAEAGFSDHTLGKTASILSIAYGAKYIEKHVTFSKMMYGSDARHSMEINEFSSFIKELKVASEMVSSSVDKDTMASDLSEMKWTFEKSLVYLKDLHEGHVLVSKDIGAKKPGTGLGDSYLNDVIGKRLLQAVRYDEQVSVDHLEGNK